MDLKTFTLTALALIAFASNSLLTRLALGSHEIDAATFSSVRLGTGAVILAFLVRSQSSKREALRSRSTRAALVLFAYAVPFSFAYLRIGAAVGALVLFGVVQLTMIGYGLFRGERPTPVTWFGLVLATIGLLSLTIPSATRPDLLGMMLMAFAGVGWAVYSLLGRGVSDPIAANARSFLYSFPLALAVNILVRASTVATAKGIVLAAVCGGITSGLGYAIWYRALPRLTITQAAVAQLTVPVIAAFGAIALLHEKLNARLLISSAAILGGVALVLLTRPRTSH